MPEYLIVSDAARDLTETLGEMVRPRDISQLFYERELRDDLCPIVGGRRLIPRDYLPEIVSALRRHQKIGTGGDRIALPHSHPVSTDSNQSAR